MSTPSRAMSTPSRAFSTPWRAGVGTWVLLSADAMLFASLLFVALYLRARGATWGEARPALVPEALLVSTLIAAALAPRLLAARPGASGDLDLGTRRRASRLAGILALAYAGGQSIALVPFTREPGAALPAAFLALSATHALHVVAAAALFLAPGGGARVDALRPFLYLLAGVRGAIFLMGRLT